MNQLNLNFDADPKIIRATLCLLQNIPLARWITYIGTTSEERHDCVDAIIERSIKASGLYNIRTIDGLKKKLRVKPWIIEEETSNLIEPIEDEESIKKIYRKIISINIRRSKSEFENLEEIRDFINPKLPLNDKKAKEVRRAWRTQAMSG